MDLKARLRTISFPAFMRHVVTAYLIAATAEYVLLPGRLYPLDSLTGLGQMSFLRLLCIMLTATAVLQGLSLWVEIAACERWGMVGCFAMLSAGGMTVSFSWPFACICGLVLVVLVVYAVRGWNGSAPEKTDPGKISHGCRILTALLALGFCALVSIWTVCRVRSFCTPTYDFGIFSQMFYSMKETGLPMTTLERDGLLSHFRVHVSPVYYLMLPFYALVPTPETLQVLQAVVLASAVIPLWKIGRLHGLSGPQCVLVCAVLLLFPAFAGGASYDLHENCFLTPLLLWLLYGLDRRSTPVTAVAGFLTLTVKEDAAVYVAVAALYLLLRTALSREQTKRRDLLTGLLLLLGALLWFFGVTTFLAEVGDGVMTYRYDNFMYDRSGSLLTVVKAVLLCPLKLLYECVDSQKLLFIASTMLPLLGLPLLTRRFERFILLIPYVLVNLMSDYQYQHNIMFQYTYGSTACLLYLTVVNLADIKLQWPRIAALAAAAAIAAGCFTAQILPAATTYPRYCQTYDAHYDQIRQTLDTIPDGASVSATTFYTTYLSQREILYDVRYCTREHLLSTEYAALRISAESDYKNYAQNGKDGFSNLIALLEKNGYELYAQMPGEMVIYKKG